MFILANVYKFNFVFLFRGRKGQPIFASPSAAPAPPLPPLSVPPPSAEPAPAASAPPGFQQVAFASAAAGAARSVPRKNAEAKDEPPAGRGDAAPTRTQGAAA